MGELGETADSDYEARLFQLLDEAAAWPRAERRRRAEAICADGPVSAEALLDALSRGEQLDDFLEQPAWQDATGIIAAGGNTSVLDEHRVGQSVGRFRLIEPIGRGGMGQVFLAEQGQPYRKVALKLIRSDGLSSAALRRFAVEQQALARLNHAHIAQLYEADLTADGEPYLAMEWVDGDPVDVFLRSHSLDLEERLKLFLDICSAIRHAHQKQIVHRDLKPSNLVVQKVDGKPVVKVIDFGIAEALDESASKLRSKKQALYGTPEYLSPEAFDGDVDTRSDVYSLGILLYELLTGTRPFRRQAETPSEFAERIRSGRVEPASQAAASLDLEVAGSREIRQWTSRLRGDLDAIIAKAMRADRETRYDSVAALAMDVERFLGNKPVRARKAGAWHLVSLFARRRRAAMIAAVVALLSIIAGGVGLGYGLLRAQNEAAETRQALREAEELSDFLIELFRESEPNRAQGQEPTARDLLAKGRERLQSEALADQPLTRARLSHTIGDVYADLGDFDDAESLMLEALRIYEQEIGKRSAEVATTLHDLGMMKTREGAYPESRSYYERALAIQEEFEATEPRALAQTVYHLGVIAFRQADREIARTHFERACPLVEELGDEEWQARCLEAFGALLRGEGKRDEARPLMEQSLEIRERVLGPEHPHVASSHSSLCVLKWQVAQFAAAERHCERALEIRKKSFEPGSHLVIGSLDEFATLLRFQGRFAEAEGLLEQALEHIRLRRPEDRWQEPKTVDRLAWVTWMQGRHSEAEQRYSEVLRFFDKPSPVRGTSKGSAWRGLGLSYWKLGRLEEAERLLDQALDFYVEQSGPETPSAGWTYWGLAGVYRDRADASRRDLERAGELYPKAIELLQRGYSEGSPYLELAQADYQEYLSKASSLVIAAKADE